MDRDRQLRGVPPGDAPPHGAAGGRQRDRVGAVPGEAHHD